MEVWILPTWAFWEDTFGKKTKPGDFEKENHLPNLHFWVPYSFSMQGVTLVTVSLLRTLDLERNSKTETVKGWLDVPLPTNVPHLWDIPNYKPYITWVFMGTRTLGVHVPSLSLETGESGLTLVSFQGALWVRS